MAIPYTPDRTSIQEDERIQLATALADYSRSITGDSAESDSLRMKAIALALRLDSANKTAVLTNAQFKRGNITPATDPTISRDDLTKLLQLQIKKIQAQEAVQGFDKIFAVYLLDFVAAINPTNEDLVYQSEIAQQKTHINWTVVFRGGGSSTAASAPTTTEPATTTSSTITRGSVVQPDAPTTVRNPDRPQPYQPYPPNRPMGPTSRQSAENTSSQPVATTEPKIKGTPPPPLQRKQSKVNGLAVISSDDNELGGKAMEIIVTASENVEGSSTCEFSTSNVSDTTKISKDEAFRAVTARHPEYGYGIKFIVSFEDKYMKNDGGSAATAYAVNMMSIIENVNIDPSVAMTGDITVDGRVRKVGGVPTKILGATTDGCKIVCIPSDNADDAGNLMVLESYRSLLATQIFSITTMDDALALARQDRVEAIANSIRLFGEVQQAMNKGATLSSPDITQKLDQVLKLTPNHLSAKYLMDRVNGTAPTVLTPPSAMNHIFQVCSPLLGFSRSLSDDDKKGTTSRTYFFVTLRKQTYDNMQKQMAQLEKKIPPQLQNTYYAMLNLLSAEQTFDEQYHGVPHRATMGIYQREFSNDVSRTSRLQSISKCYDAVVSEVMKLEYDKKFVESQIR